MTAVAVILAGGKGSRSADPSTAKLAQRVGGASLMEWHLALLEPCEIDQAIVIAGHLGDQVRELCSALDDQGVSTTVVQEKEQRGTVAALKLAAQETEADEFLVILGDILMSLPLQDLLDAWRMTGKGVAVAVHPSTHPEDSDAAFPRTDGAVVVLRKSQPRDHLPNMSSAGLFAITRQALDRYAASRDLGSDLLEAAAADGDLYAFVTSHYLKDTGTPGRLDSARDDVDRGAFARRGSLEPRAALFLDRDGVINPSAPDFHGPEDYRLMPAVGSAIREANRAGIPVIVVTNQPAIAKGFMTESSHELVRARMDSLLGADGAFVDDYLFCPHHPDRGFPGERIELKGPCGCRKPGIAMAETASARHRLDLARSIMVGDTDRDRGFAEGAGMRFLHVADACDACTTADCFHDPAAAIRQAVEDLTC